MDRRSWPWKMKTSLKAITDKMVSAAESALASDGSARQEAKFKTARSVKKSRGSYTLTLTSLEHHVITLKDEIKIWREEVQDLTQKLCEAQLEMTAKDGLVNQHSKVAEEAVSGWEKAKAKYVALKSQLESVTLAKLTAENRASHLDSALKECMMQVTLVKEESKKLLNGIIRTKSEEWDVIKLDLEGQIAELDQRLLRSAAENAALSRSLQEHSDILTKINEDKSQVELENQVMRGKAEDYEKEIYKHKYEMNVLTKEVEIRNEEKTMSMKSAEAANKQHLEGVKKIVKLEAECQRLRGLVRKKLPGPAALAEMKKESAYLDGESVIRPQARKPPVKNSRTQTQSSSVAKFSIPPRKESELLKKRLLMMEEKTKMLKEALDTQNNSDTNDQVGIGKPRTIQAPSEGSLRLHGNGRPQSVASISDDGFDEDGVSSVGSWIESISNLSHLSRDTTSSELMDDFLEMERRLTCSSPLDHESKQNEEVAAAEAKPAHAQELHTRSTFHYSAASVEALERIQHGSTPFLPTK